MKLILESEIESTFCPGSGMVCTGNSCAAFNYAEDEYEYTYAGCGKDGQIEHFFFRSSAETMLELWEPPLELEGYKFHEKLIEVDDTVKLPLIPKFVLMAEYRKLKLDRKWYCGLTR